MSFGYWLMVMGVATLSLILTGLLRHYALRRGLMDVPNERSSHVLPTPRGGGMGFVSGFVLVVVMCWMAGYSHYLPGVYVVGILIPALAMALLGFWDDHGHVPASLRFVSHLLAALTGLWVIGLPVIPLGGYLIDTGILGYGLFALAMVWFLNLFNFMDGIDGIAGIETLTIAVSAILLMQLTDGDVLLSQWLGVFAAGVAGFLFWNWPPARIFMGDAGSGFIGYAIGAFAIASAVAGELNVWAWLILTAAFVADATVTLIRRMLSGQRWYAAHRSHAYQILSRRWQSHRRVTLLTLAINLCWLLPLAWCAEHWPGWGVVIAVVAYLPLTMASLLIGAGRQDAG